MYANFILLVVVNQNNKILLLRRINTPFCNGCYCLPGREIQYGESASKAATNEAAASLGIDRMPTAHDCIHVMHRKCNEPEFFAAVFKIQLNKDEVPQLLQPERYDNMLWATFDHLPEKMVPAHRHALEQVQSNKFYSEHGWA